MSNFRGENDWQADHSHGTPSAFVLVFNASFEVDTHKLVRYMLSAHEVVHARYASFLFLFLVQLQ